MLRTRLFLYLLPFVAILLGVGFYAIALFSRMTSQVGDTVTGNYQSVLAVQKMKLALTRMEDGVLQGVEENKALGSAIFERNQTEFDKALRDQLGNGKTVQERELNQRLKNEYQTFLQAGKEILLLDDPDERRKAFKLRMEAAYPAVDKMLDQIHRLNDAAILATTQNVQEITSHVTQLMIIGMVVAVVIAGYAGYRLARSILGPIQSLTRATQDLGHGNLDQLVPVASKDELGTLAESFNKMAAQLRLYRQSTADRIVRLHGTMDATLASFPDPIYVLDRDGRIELMNLAAKELARGLGLEEELPEHVREVAHKALSEGKSYMAHSFKDVVSFRLHGKEEFFLPRVLVMRNEDETLIGVAVVLYDVTRFRLLDDAKTNLVSTVSHEIRTPLTSVRMALHLLLEKTVGALTPRQNDLLTAARDDSERLLRILNDLLDLTRLEEGNTDLNKERIAPTDLMQGAVELTRDAVSGRSLRLTCKAEADLPPVQVDRQRISHVFTNLIINAVKYSPPGGEIVLAAARAGEREVQFSVTDQGPGVPEDQHERIFDRFYRVPGQTKTGAGLGLSIAREIVVAHGGRIGVRNGAGHGCEFFFVLGSEDGEPTS